MQSQLEHKLNHRFLNKNLLEEALVHKSFAVERGLSFHNERLEFLGDSVLGLCVAHYLFSKYPSISEGGLSKIKSNLVSKKALAHFARKLVLEKHLKLGSDAQTAKLAGRDSILANAFEAILGALYLDAGWDTVFTFLKDFLENSKVEDRDYKSRLQEIVQKKMKTLPSYEVIKTEGPEHEKIFTVTISIKGKHIALGKGRSKKDAEQSAACSAIEILENGGKNDFR